MELEVILLVLVGLCYNRKANPSRHRSQGEQHTKADAIFHYFNVIYICTNFKRVTGEEKEKRLPHKCACVDEYGALC